MKENKFEPFRTINTLLETLEKMSITDSTQYLMQCFYSLIIDLEEKIGGDDKAGVEFEDTFYAQEMSEEQLSYVSPPFLPDLPPEKKSNTYTLVIDLDETLVHYEEVFILFARIKGIFSKNSLKTGQDNSCCGLIQRCFWLRCRNLLKL